MQKVYEGIGLGAGIKTIIGSVEFSVNMSSLSHQMITEVRIGYVF